MLQIYSLDFNSDNALALAQLTERNMRTNISPFTNKACLVDSAPLYSETALLDGATRPIQEKALDLPFSHGARGLIHKGERLVIYGMRHYSADAITLLGEHIYAPTKKNPFRYRILPDANGYMVIDTKGNEHYCTLAELKQHVLTNAYIVRGQVYGDTTQYCTWALPDANHTGYYDYQEHNMLAAWNKTAELPFDECPVITGAWVRKGYRYTGYSPVVILNEDVTSIATGMFSGCSELTTVACRGENIVVGNYAFADKRALNLVHIPGGVQVLNKGAFSNTPRLHRIYLRLRNSEVQLRSALFVDSGLCSLTIKAEKPVKEIHPDWLMCGTTYLREYRQIGRLDADNTVNLKGFAKCPTLRYVYLNLGIDFNIGEKCFEDCRGLEIVETAENIISVGESAFSGCNSLTSIDLSHCIRVDTMAFYYCVKLARIELLRCKYIGKHAFYACTSLHDLCLRMCSICFEAFCGSFIQGAKLGLQRCSIHSYSFGHTGIGTLYIENSIVSNTGTFRACSHLTSVVWRNMEPEYAGLHITPQCFIDCSALQKVVIQAEVITLEPKCFMHCSALQTLMINATKECSVESDAFIGCGSLIHLHFAQQPRLQQGALDGTPRELQLQYALLGYTL